MSAPAKSAATSQSHGDAFQDAIKGDDWFRGAADHGRSRRSAFDIEARFDKRASIPTQIKVSGDFIYEFADARRWYAIDEPHRNVLANWVQDRQVKRIVSITEIILHGRMLPVLRGRTSAAEVSDCHDAIRALRRIPAGREYDRQRKLVDARIADLCARTDGLTFHAKIGSGNDRLQISASLDTLGRVSRTEDRYRCINGRIHRNREVYTRFYGERISLPHPIRSGRRVFKDGSGGGPAAAFAPLPDLFDDFWECHASPSAANDAGPCHDRTNRSASLLMDA